MDINAFKKRRQEQQAASPVKKGFEKLTFFKTDQHGFYDFYICPPNSEMDDCWYIPLLRHKNVGPDERSVMCLSKENKLLWSAPMQRAIAARNADVAERHPDWVQTLDPEAGCPICEEIASPETSNYSEEELTRMQLVEELIAPIILWWFKDLQGNNKREVPDAQKTIEMWSVRNEEVISDFIGVQEVDVTNPKGAVLFILKKGVKKGGSVKVPRDNRYSVEVDQASLTNRVKLTPPIRALLKKLEPGETLDPMLFIASQVRDYDTVKGFLTGVEIQKAAPHEDPDGPPQCFKTDIIDVEDETCQACAFKVDCAAATDSAVPPDVGGKKVADKPQPAAKAASVTEVEVLTEALEDQQRRDETTPAHAPKAAPRPQAAPAPRPAVQAKAAPAPRPQAAQAAPKAEPKPAPKEEELTEEDEAARAWEEELKGAMGATSPDDAE